MIDDYLIDIIKYAQNKQGVVFSLIWMSFAITCVDSTFYIRMIIFL